MLRIALIPSLLVLHAPALGQQIEIAQDSEFAAFDGAVWTAGIPDPDVSEQLSSRPVPLSSDISDIAFSSLQTPDEAQLVNEGPENFRIGAIGVVGAEAMNIEIFSSVVEDFIGHEASTEELTSLTQQIANIAREEGYILASAYIPEQSVQMGVLEIKLIEGTIDAVQIIGSDNRHLRKILSSLEGKVAHRPQIERQLLLASDIPDIVVVSSDFRQENGQNILQVTVRERGDSFRIEGDNYGSHSYGPARARLSGDLRGKIHDSDVLGTAIRANPVEPKEILSVSAYYETALGTDGIRAGIAGSVGENAPGGTAASSNITGESRYLGLFASYPLVRSTSGSLWIETQAAYLSIDNDAMNVLIRQDTEVTVSVGVRSEISFAGGKLRAGASIVHGFDIFGATRLGDPMASRRDGDGVFTKGEYWADFRTGLAKDINIYLAARGQIASEPLLATQELSIGGAYRVRGYDFSELSGDDGFYAMAELQYNLKSRLAWLKSIQLYGFGDIGYVNDLGNNSSEGTLISAGPGIRGTVGPLDFEFETALPVNRDRKHSGNKKPHINVKVGINF
ncbi:MAG: ShlB/FhaC/HecB family hemolysin secretion/activation protein [Parasphingorhabdus sp.]|uniref:ShlB/FhaC/HecB family hemolysin secretion/activation protein n=1 Tax=Parasphingorhabdus sp. TaxID=2709688 RepID=UPI0030031960